jgi:hypothetical protein
MEARVAYRTHYQVDEPAYLELLVERCALPTRSAYREQVGARVFEEVKRLGGSLNPAAGGYAVDLAVALRLLTPQNAWAELGHLVHLVTKFDGRPLSEELDLTPSEALMHLRLFLEGDGAALVYLARRALECDVIDESVSSWNEIAREMFADIFAGYLRLASLTADRVAIRQTLDRVVREGFRGRTGAHKLFIHLQVLTRVGLLAREDTGGPRRYRVAARGALSRLRDLVPDYGALEEIATRRTWIDAAINVLDPDTQPGSVSGDELLRTIVPFYVRTTATGVAVCPIRPLLDALIIRRLVNERQRVSSEDALKMLAEVQRGRAKDVRFHVDRTGRPAFLKLSASVVNAFSSG